MNNLYSLAFSIVAGMLIGTGEYLPGIIGIIVSILFLKNFFTGEEAQ